jgi:formylglycine-generating enzyme required for sulfatase activity
MRTPRLQALLFAGLIAFGPGSTRSEAGESAAVRRTEFTNSLGMKFVAVPGTAVSFCVWETRKQDFAAFARTRPGVDDAWKEPSFKAQPVSFAPDHPVVNVSWEDAKAFCDWLTEKERREGRLAEGARYRLPTDLEWSAAAGLPKENGDTPKARDRQLPELYPWGKQFPPPAGAGNYADLASRLTFGNDWETIPGFRDGFPTTAPVGSYAANQFGLFDLGGNVWEWCEDFMDGQSGYRVTRGGSWVNAEAEYLWSSARNSRPPEFRRHAIGFRVVLTNGAAKQ